MLENVNQLLDLTKLEDNSFQLIRTRTDFISFLDHIISSFKLLGEKAHLTLQFKPHVNTLPANFDTYKFHKIVQNLLSNAIKFTKEGGKITVQTLETEHFINIHVTDTGIGIPQKKIPLIFERFYQVESDISRSYEGTGIGMSVVKEFTELHDGSVHVESKEGVGTTISLQFPKSSFLDKQDMFKPDFNEFQHHETEKNNHIQILIVEDNIDLRLYLKRTLSSYYRIHTAENGRIGIEKAQAILPDIILSDVMMPEVSGFELLKSIKKNLLTNHIPVLLLTAKNEIEDKLKGLRIGADDYIGKPFQTEEILLRIKNSLTTRENLKEKLQTKVITGNLNNTASPEESFLKKIETLVLDSLNDVDFSIDNLTTELHMSRSVLHRKFKAVSNIPLSAFIRSVRLREGKKLIETKAHSIAEISSLIGFRNSTYFISSFKKEYGITPKEYEKSFH